MNENEAPVANGMSDAVRTAGGSVALAFQSAVNSVLGLVLFIFLARLISQVEMGIYASLLLAMALFQTVGPLGLQVAAARFIPKSIGEGRNDQVSTYVTSIVVVSFVSAIALSVSFSFLSTSLSLFLTKSAEYGNVFALASVAVSFSIPAANLDAVMQGFQDFRRLAAVRVFSQGLRVAISVVLLVMGYALIGVVWGLIAMNVSLLFIFMYLVRSNLKVSIDSAVISRLLKYSSPLLLANLANFLSGQADLLVLMIVMIPVVVGVYQVAVTVSGLLGAILIATITATVQPVAAKRFGSSGKSGLESVLAKASRYLAFVYVPAAFGLAALAGTAINLMAGQRYLEATTPLAVISLVSIASALSIIPIIGLQAVGDTGSVLVATILSVAIGTAVDVALIPGFGGLGAALGRAALMLAVLVASVHLARSRMAVKFDLRALRKSTLASITMGIVLVAMQTRFGFAAYNALLYIPTGLAIFLGAMRLQGAFKRRDMNILLEVLPSRLRWISKLVSWMVTG
jgi:O-antigen/teichoic acid export membrane protein